MRYHIKKSKQPEIIRVIHKADFIARLLPYWNDLREARVVDATLDGYFELFKMYPHVDLDWPKTIMLVNDMVARTLAVRPDSLITVEDILRDGTEEERA